MQDFELVPGEGERLRHPAAQPQRFGLGQHDPAVDGGAQVVAIHERHREVVNPRVFPGVENGDDVGVVQLGRDADLGHEAGHERRFPHQGRGEDFEGHMALDQLLLRQPDLAHRAGPEFADEGEVAQPHSRADPGVGDQDGAVTVGTLGL